MAAALDSIPNQFFRYTFDKTMSLGVEFDYPSGDQYPFDDTCAKIVKALEKRDWTIPGIQVQFLEHRILWSHSICRYVSKIQGADFSLSFTRRGNWTSGAGTIRSEVSTIEIPEKGLDVYEDEAVTYRIYAGLDVLEFTGTADASGRETLTIVNKRSSND